MKKFDIIIVCYDDNKRLYETLKSVEECSFTGNVIIKDGLSNSEIDFLSDFNLNIIYENSIDNGLYDAMNLASKLVISDYFLTINCGDLLHPKYTDIYPYLQNDFDLLCTSVLLKKICGNTITYNADCMDIHERMSVCHQGIFINRHFFTNVGGYDCKYKICADYDFLNRSVSSNSTIAFINNLNSCIFEGFDGMSDKFRFRLELETAMIRYKRTKKFNVYFIHFLRYFNFKLNLLLRLKKL